MPKIKEKNSIWIRSYQKAIFTSVNRETRQKEIEKNKEKALNSDDILKLLKGAKNFLGVFASDEISNLRILAFPVFLIVNLDSKTLPGSHWIALRLDKNTVEIFDSLGFDRNMWGKFPDGLRDFFDRYKYSHRFRISPVLQPASTSDCGFFCVFFVLYRPNNSFTNCVSVFSRVLTRNHFILIKKLKSI